MTKASSRRSPRQERSRLTYDAIVEAAAQVLETRGYTESTTNHIADRAGVSIGTLYQYFANKDELLNAVAHRHLADVAVTMGPLIDALHEDPPQPPEAMLERFLRAMLELHRVRPNLHRALRDEIGRLVEFRASVDSLEDAFGEQVAEYLTREGVVSPHHRTVGRLIVTAVDAMAHQWIADHDRREDDDVFLRSAIELLAPGLALMTSTPPQ